MRAGGGGVVVEDKSQQIKLYRVKEVEGQPQSKGEVKIGEEDKETRQY